MLSSPFIPEPLLTLDTEELILVNTNGEKNRLAFALMLKFFQTKGRYPTRKDKIDPMTLYSLASQLKVSSDLFEPSYLESRISERFRRKIRKFTGYKIASLSDSRILIAWLIEQMAQGPYTMPQLREKACQVFKEHKLEPFTQERTDRYIRSAIHQFEKQFFASITKQLSPKTINVFSNLLIDDPDDNNAEPDANTKITLRRLKTDTPDAKLNNVEFEIKKLMFMRGAPIPAEVFDDASRKLIQKYYQRIMAASPSNVLEFIPHARFASMACFPYPFTTING